MAFYVVRHVDGNDIWLKRVTPWVVWGPQDQALVFPTQARAAAAARRVPPAWRDGLQIVAAGPGAPGVA
jgi:hypothetical protein